ncbi:hypothetical protein AB1E33_25025 [Ruegeria sp. 2012CJ15-1]
MSEYLLGASFNILQESGSTLDSFRWLEIRAAQPQHSESLPVTTQLLFGAVSQDMVQNQLLGLLERRMLTY